MWTILIDRSILLLHPLSQVGMESVFPYLWFHSESLLVPIASPEPKRNFIKTKTGNTFQKQYYNTFISGRCLYSIELICDPFMQMDYIICWNYRYFPWLLIYLLKIAGSGIVFSTSALHAIVFCCCILHGSCQKTDFIIASVGLTLVLFMIRIACGFFLLIRYASPDLTVCISTRVQIRGGGQNII